MMNSFYYYNKMPYKDPVRNLECIRKWKRENREHIKRVQKEYYDLNRENILLKLKIQRLDRTLNNSRFEVEVYDALNTDLLIWQGVAPSVQEMLLLWSLDHPKSNFLNLEKIKNRLKPKKPPLDDTIKVYIDGKWTDEIWE